MIPSPDDTAAAARALNTLTHPHAQAKAFVAMCDTKQAAFVRKHIAPITKVLKEATGLSDLNRLDGIVSGVARYDRTAKQQLGRIREEAVEEFRSLEEQRLRRTAALTHYGRGASLSAMTDIRHAECKEEISEARARGPLRAPRATQALHRIWFASTHVLDGFRGAVGLEPTAYLELPRGTAAQCEAADVFDRRKVQYYAECVLQATYNTSLSLCIKSLQV